MFFITSKVLSFVIKPIVWIFIFLSSSLIFKKKRKTIIYITFFTFYILTNSFIADGLSKIWEVPPKSIVSLKKNYKYGIVLGGYSSYNNAAQHIDFTASGDRLISAIELYKLDKIEKIILSGGNGNLIQNSMKESEWSREILLNMGVEKKDIILENKSRNSMENAQNTIRLIGKDISGKSLLITSANHMRRAIFCFNKNNCNIDHYPTDCTNPDIELSFNYLFIPNINALEKWESILHECIGYIVYRIKF